MSVKTVSSIDDMKDEFGSYASLARALGMSPQALHDAKKFRGTLPMAKAFAQRAALLNHGIDAPLSLWGFDTSGAAPKQGAAA